MSVVTHTLIGYFVHHSIAAMNGYNPQMASSQSTSRPQGQSLKLELFVCDLRGNFAEMAERLLFTSIAT